MKKQLFLISCLIYLIACTNTTETAINNDWKNYKLKGKVKAIREIKFLAVDNFSIIENGERVKHIYNQEMLFNLDGFKIEKNDYIPDGTLANRTMYLYQNNKLVEYNDYDSQGMLFGTGKYSDSKEYPRLNYKTSDGRYNWTESYQYNEKGLLTEINQFKTEQVIDQKEKYTYDNQGNIIESELYKDNKLVAKNTYQYDKDHNNIELRIGDTITYSYKYNYDSKGNWIKKIVFENDNPSGILIREIEYFN